MNHCLTRTALNLGLPALKANTLTTGASRLLVKESRMVSWLLVFNANRYVHLKAVIRERGTRGAESRADVYRIRCYARPSVLLVRFDALPGYGLTVKLCSA